MLSERIREKRLSIVASYTALAILAICVLSGCGSTSSSTELWGRAEAKEVDINSKIPGRVVALLVKEGERVEKGQLLARIDKRDITAQSEQALANIKALEAQAAQAVSITELQDHTAKASLNTAKAQMERARAELNLAKNDFARFKQLMEMEAISKQLFDSCQRQLKNDPLWQSKTDPPMELRLGQ